MLLQEYWKSVEQLKRKQHISKLLLVLKNPSWGEIATCLWTQASASHDGHIPTADLQIQKGFYIIND